MGTLRRGRISLRASQESALRSRARRRGNVGRRETRRTSSPSSSRFAGSSERTRLLLNTKRARRAEARRQRETARTAPRRATARLNSNCTRRRTESKEGRWWGGPPWCSVRRPRDMARVSEIGNLSLAPARAQPVGAWSFGGGDDDNYSSSSGG